MPSINNAISQRRFKQVNFLVKAGVNLNCKNSNGETPLLQVCDLEPEEKAVGLAKVLIAKGAKVDVGDTKGKTALMRAILNGKGKLVSLFLGEILDINLNAKDFDGNTALAHAAYVGNEKIVRQIVQSLRKFGLTVDARNKDGLTPLMIAAKNGHLSCVEVILNVGKACRFIRDDLKWQTASEWEKCVAQATPQLEQDEVIGRASPSSASNSFCKSSQKKEIRQLFHVYEGQLSTAYRKGFDSSKYVSLYERLGFQTTQNSNENVGESEEKVSSHIQASFLFAKGAAIVKFKRNGGLLNARKLAKNGCSTSFPPGNLFLKELAENHKENNEYVDAAKQRASRPRRPIRCRSEIIYKLKSDKVREQEREKTFHCERSLPKILLQEPAFNSSTVLTVHEENENIDNNKKKNMEYL